MRELSYAEAVREGTQLCLRQYPEVFLMGLGVPDPKGIFGTTLGLQQEFGEQRVFDVPASENAMTGVAIGAALAGKRPILTHQRVDFALLSLEQIINQAAKWHYMFGGQSCVPLVIRMIIGRGWGQGPQHSQSLYSLFAHIPGLKVVMPTSPEDAKGLLIASVEDNNPVIFIEHRWLHQVRGRVPEGLYRTEIGKPKVVRAGTDITIVSLSHMTLEALKAAETLQAQGVSAEVIDLRSLRPLDLNLVHESVKKTAKLAVAETGTLFAGFGAEIIAQVTEKQLNDLELAPLRIGCPESPAPTSCELAKHYYPTHHTIASAILDRLGINYDSELLQLAPATSLDVPDPSFVGPF